MPVHAPCHALVPAAGSGSRMAASLPKQYLPLAGRPLIFHALRALCDCADLVSVHVVLAPADPHWCLHADLWAGLGDKLRVHHCGGASRAESVLAGLRAMQHVADAAYPVADEDWVLVHDAARPGITPSLVSRLIAVVARQAGSLVGTCTDARATDVCGGILALPVADTLKRARPQEAADSARIEVSVPRSDLWQAQTPQMFRHRELQQALRAAAGSDSITDEASALERLGRGVCLVPGALSNFKVTYAADLELAEIILQQRAR